MLFTFVRLYRKIRSRKSIGFGVIFLLLLFSLAGNSLCYYFFDGVLKPELTMADALWYSIISMTTIGYGDHSAESAGARIGTIIFVVLIGLSSFTVFLGMLIDSITVLTLRGQRGLLTIMASNHILIVNFPSEARIKQLIKEIKHEVAGESREIVIVTDQIERLPFTYEGVLFVHGSPLEAETYERARMKEAKRVIVLAPSYEDPNSDAVVASAISVIDSIKAEAHIVAECLDEKHAVLFEAVRCDAIVFGLKIAGNLLVQELHDPGVAQTVDAITSNLEGATLFTTQVTAPNPDTDYGRVAKGLIDRGINLLCINRGNRSFLPSGSRNPEARDTIVYIGSKRLDWKDLLQLSKK
jgi:voltage-gated potassium channel